MTAPRHFRLTRPQIQALIVLGILVITAGLILTGVVRVRQTAARIECQNNLKQLALGMLTYCSANRHRLPPLVDQGEDAPTGHGLQSVFASFEPYIEAGPVTYSAGSPPEKYHAHSTTPFPIRHKDGTMDTLYGGLANRHRWPLFCPSDTTADKLRDVPVTLPDGSTGYYATGSYVANGLLPWNQKKVTLSSANTILFAERPQVCRTASGEAVHTLWGVGFYSPQMPAFATLTPTEPPGLWCTGQVAPALPLPEADGEVPVRIGWANAEPQVPDFVHPVQQIRTDRPCDPRLPGATHPDGMTVAMADGSVRVFRYDVSPRVFWAACVPER
jgi:prepilin-type processing-associated H-X9-DG protein